MMVCGQAFVKFRACSLVGLAAFAELFLKRKLSFPGSRMCQHEKSAEGAEREVAEFVKDDEVGVLGPIGMPQFDPLRTFKMRPVNGREARESGLSLERHSTA